VASFENGNKGPIEGGFPIGPLKEPVTDGYFGYIGYPVNKGLLGAPSINGKPWILDAPTRKRDGWRYYSEAGWKDGDQLSERGRDHVWIKDRPTVHHLIFSDNPWFNGVC